MKLNSIDYLLKPIRKSDLAESLKKYQSIKTSFFINFEAILKNLRQKEISYKSRFLIQYGSKIKKVETEEIAYFYAMEKSVFLMNISGNSYPVDFSLDKLMEILDPLNFFRINRKMIISFNSIKTIITIFTFEGKAGAQSK